MTLAMADFVAAGYTIEREIGRGGMAVVYEAIEHDTKRRVALKRLLPAFAADATCVARFDREARAAMTLTSEHAVHVHGVGTCDDGAPYIAMELLTGKDLASVRSEASSRATETSVDWILEALDAIAEAHAAGIVHRDVKPHNLFLAQRADGSVLVKVLDFGIAKAVWADGQVTRTKDVIGSPAYMSPEQARSSRDVDARTDIWSLGVCLYELLTGALPFDAASVPEIFSNILVSDPTPPALVAARIPSALSNVVMRCLAKDAAARWSDVAALAAALEPFGSPASAGAAARVATILARRVSLDATAPAQAFEAKADAPEAPTPGSKTEPMPDRPHVPAGPKRGRQVVFGAFALALAIVGFLGVRSAFPDSPAPTAGETTVAPDESIEELLPPPLPSSAATANDTPPVEMTFDVDAATGTRNHPRGGTRSPRHRRPPSSAPRPPSSAPAARY